MTYKRKTKDEYQMHSNYGYGWECEVSEDTRKEIKIRLKEYRENCPNGQYKIVVRRIKIQDDAK